MAPSLTPEERSTLASIASHTSWGRTPDRAARTLPARQAMAAKFEEMVDPERRLDPAERALRADHMRRAHYQRLALKSARARRAAAAMLAEAEKAEGVLHASGGHGAA